MSAALPAPGPHLGAAALRVQPVGRIHARIELLDADPLTGTVALQLPAAPGRVVLGRDEGARELTQDWADLAHMIVQGVTRSGKACSPTACSRRWRADQRITVCGIDPTGLLFRPFAGTRHATHQVSGVADPQAYLRLHDLVAEMDERITSLPPTATPSRSPLRRRCVWSCSRSTPGCCAPPIRTSRWARTSVRRSGDCWLRAPRPGSGS
ncbi:hypothetical protein [Pseudonocardia sp. Ae707_Ps1]|uniref:hypothetical protein n=1 Tax=Pseudonocardia sp. Ae707_Ps1 TaxID=1885572 RepID=UPI00094AEC13|nr:hypothetical protein [Pseudonocardia sp. Ae707_Ps1]